MNCVSDARICNQKWPELVDLPYEYDLDLTQKIRKKLEKEHTYTFNWPKREGLTKCPWQDSQLKEHRQCLYLTTVFAAKMGLYLYTGILLLLSNSP